MRVLHIVVVSPMLPCLPVILVSPLPSPSFPSPLTPFFILHPLLCWPTAGTSYFSLCWCNNLKSHNKATYCWHRDRAAWLLLLRSPFLISLSLSPCLLRLCLTITIFLWIWIWLLARIDCKTSLQPSPQMCSSSQVHTSLLTLPLHPILLWYYLLLPAVSSYIYFSYFSLQRASKTELRLNSSRHFFSIFEFSFLSCRRQVKSRLDTLNTQGNTLTHTLTHTLMHSACFHVEIEIFPIEIAIVFCHCVARPDVLQLLECLLCPATLTPRTQSTMGY